RRSAEIFLYDIFREQELLRAKGLKTTGAKRAAVNGFVTRIGQRTALVPTAGARVHGVVMSLTLAELERLYSEPSVEAYKPQAVLAQLAGGGLIAALCYNLPQAPSPTERNPDYAAKLRAVAQKVGLPAEYVAALQ